VSGIPAFAGMTESSDDDEVYGDDEVIGVEFKVFPATMSFLMNVSFLSKIIVKN
jgi:hypothetical protein